MRSEFFPNGSEVPETPHLEMASFNRMVGILHPQATFIFKQAIDDRISPNSPALRGMASRLKMYHGKDRRVSIIPNGDASSTQLGERLHAALPESQIGVVGSALDLTSSEDMEDVLLWAAEARMPFVYITLIPPSRDVCVNLYKTLEHHKDLADYLLTD